MNDVKSKSRGISSDMSSAAIERRLEIVDELRELGEALKNAKRLGPLTPDPSPRSGARGESDDEKRLTKF